MPGFANSKSSSTLAHGVTLLHKPRFTALYWPSTVKLFKNEGQKLLQTTAQELENCSFLFFSFRWSGSNRDPAPHRFDDANRYALCTTFIPCLWRSRSMTRTPPNSSAALALAVLLCSPPTSRSRFHFACRKITPVKLIRIRFICEETNRGLREKAKKKKKKKTVDYRIRIPAIG